MPANLGQDYLYINIYMLTGSAVFLWVCRSPRHAQGASIASRVLYAIAISLCLLGSYGQVDSGCLMRRIAIPIAYVALDYMGAGTYTALVMRVHLPSNIWQTTAPSRCCLGRGCPPCLDWIVLQLDMDGPSGLP